MAALGDISREIKVSKPYFSFEIAVPCPPCPPCPSPGPDPGPGPGPGPGPTPAPTPPVGQIFPYAKPAS